jgi:FSR family fosmidomycin resistance protein-like MFS transporter
VPQQLPDRRELTALTGSHAVDDFYQGAIPALVALLVTTRSYGYAAASGITLAGSLLSSVVQPAFGAITDRRELRWLVPVGMAVAGIGIGLCGLVDNYAWTWGCVALSGLGVAAYHPQAARSAGRAAAGSAAGLSWFTLGGNVGYAAGPVITTPLLVAAGLTGTIWLALPAVLYALFLARRLAAGPPPAPAPTVPADPGAAEAVPDRWRAFGWLTAVVSVRSIFFFGVSSFLALYVLERLRTDPATGAAATSVLFAAGVIGTIVGGRLADTIGRVRAMQLGYLLSMPGLVGLLLATSLPVSLASVALLGVAIYLPVSVQVTLGQEYLPNRVGTASGVTLGLAVSAGGIAAPLLGLLADARGLPLTLTLLLALPVVALLMTRRLPETATTTPSDSPQLTR